MTTFYDSQGEVFFSSLNVDKIEKEKKNEISWFVFRNKNSNKISRNESIKILFIDKTALSEKYLCWKRVEEGSGTREVDRVDLD